MFSKEIRDFYLEQLHTSAKKDEETYDSQKFFGEVIFWFVLALVFCGIVFSAFQLWIAIKYGNITQLNTNLELQTSGKLVITTSLVGVFVLVVSLAFFFLFLQYVYKPNSKRKDFFENIYYYRTFLDNKGGKKDNRK